jgi:hypothetical protein
MTVEGVEYSGGMGVEGKDSVVRWYSKCFKCSHKVAQFIPCLSSGNRGRVERAAPYLLSFQKVVNQD